MTDPLPLTETVDDTRYAVELDGLTLVDDFYPELDEATRKRIWDRIKAGLWDE